MPLISSRNIYEECEAFRNSEFKIAFQKDGALSTLSEKYLVKAFGTGYLHRSIKSRKLFEVYATPYGNVGVCYIKNLDLLEFVSAGYVDATIVGSDTLIERHLGENTATLVKMTYEKWPVYFLTPSNASKPLEEVRVVATPFPVVTRECLHRLGNDDVKIVVVHGATEVLPNLSADHGFDGIVEIVVSGETARANGLVVHTPPLTHFYPVIVANKSALKDVRKAVFFSVLRSVGTSIPLDPQPSKALNLLS